MGKQNRQRRAAKKRKQDGARQRTSGAGRARSDAAGPFAPPDPMELVATAVWAHGRGAEELFDEAIAALLTAPRAALARDLTSWLAGRVAALWDRGWQPADLHRVVARELSPREAGLLAGAIVAGSSSYRALGEQVAPRWLGQVDALAGGTVHHLPAEGVPWVDLLVASVRLRYALEQLPDLPLLEPPPSEWRTGMRAASAASGSDGVLDKVRALLAKAESTDFDAEAEAFTAKAQELMARHRIDQAALVRDGGGSSLEIVGRRIGIDDPYADAKASLLAGICVANGARAVWTKHAGFTTVFGFPAEVEIVEELFTSLLVQSSAALRREGSKHDRFGRSRTTRFRRAFLHAFAQRVAGRLRAVADATLDADDRRSSLLPVLASREAAVDSAVAEAFPDMTSFAPPRFGDREGWVAGTLFGEAADLGVGDLLERRSAS